MKPNMTERLSWWQEDPRRMVRERDAMELAAPDLRWLETEPSGGWLGTVPLWPFDRAEPQNLDVLVGANAFTVRIVCGNAYPMVEPEVKSANVEPPIEAFGWTAWHVLPNGNLCLLQDSAMWDPGGTVADLVPKISGWYIEYHLMLARKIDAMTQVGIASNADLDHLIEECERTE